MTLKLHLLSGSPFAWRCQLAAEHKGGEWEKHFLEASKGELQTSAYLAINPRGKAPSLEDGDFRLYEAPAIVAYLEERFADGPSLFPGNAQQRALIRRMINELDVYLWPACWKVASNVFFKPKEQWDEGEIARGRDEILAELSRIEDWLDGDYLAGDLSAADFTLYPFLGHIGRYELRKGDLGLTDSFGPKLRAWMRRIEALPYFDASYPPHWK